MIIGAKNCTKRDHRVIQAALPPRQHLLRQKSKWITKDVLCFIIRTIAWNLRDMMPASEVVLLLDCLSLHVNEEVLLVARDAKIHIVLVPARLTWILQPLDVYVFALFKRFLRSVLLRPRVQQPSTLPSSFQWIMAIPRTIRLAPVWSPMIEVLLVFICLIVLHSPLVVFCGLSRPF